MFREMSETELVINSIENVKMISIYELTGIGDEPDKGCAAISILYGKDKYINLCELDDGFEILADKVFEIYGDIGDKSEVLVDDRTRAILEGGWQDRNEEFLEKYYQMESSQFPKVAFESATGRRIMPLVKYIVEAVYKILGIKYEITLTKNGWRGAGVIYGIHNGDRVVSGVKVIQNSNREYLVYVNNFIETANVLELTVVMGNDCIIVRYACDYRDIHGTGIYSLEQNGYTESHETYRDGQLIFKDSRDVCAAEAKPDEEVKKLVPWQYDGKSVVELPWGMKYIIERDCSKKNSCVIDEYRNCFLYPEAHYSENRCWTRVTNDDKKFSLKTSSVVMHIMTLPKRAKQVYFMPLVGNHKSRYRHQLEGRIFVEE